MPWAMVNIQFSRGSFESLARKNGKLWSQIGNYSRMSVEKTVTPVHPRVYYTYSRRPLTFKSVRELNLNADRDIKSCARTIRVMWFLYNMGNDWHTLQDLSELGAGHWYALGKTCMTDGLKDGFIECLPGAVAKKNLFRLTPAGLALIDDLEKVAKEDWEHVTNKMAAFREKKAKQNNKQK